ncbi:hypothetical protein BH11ACT4_BH11ACT4_14020 [soil metagenome]
MTRLASRPSLWLTIAAAALLTAGCTAPAADGGSTSSGDGTASGGAGAGASSEKCPVIPGYEYFSDSSVTKYPEAGQVYGDGTAITFEAPADYYATYSLYYVDEKGTVFEKAGGAFSQEAPDGVFTTSLPLFGEEANGRPGIIELDTVYKEGMKLDTVLDTYKPGVSTVVVGRYCLTLKINP